MPSKNLSSLHTLFFGAHGVLSFFVLGVLACSISFFADLHRTPDLVPVQRAMIERFWSHHSKPFRVEKIKDVEEEETQAKAFEAEKRKGLVDKVAKIFPFVGQIRDSLSLVDDMKDVANTVTKREVVKTNFKPVAFRVYPFLASGAASAVVKFVDTRGEHAIELGLLPRSVNLSLDNEREFAIISPMVTNPVRIAFATRDGGLLAPPMDPGKPFSVGVR